MGNNQSFNDSLEFEQLYLDKKRSSQNSSNSPTIPIYYNSKKKVLNTSLQISQDVSFLEKLISFLYFVEDNEIQHIILDFTPLLKLSVFDEGKFFSQQNKLKKIESLIHEIILILNNSQKNVKTFKFLFNLDPRGEKRGILSNKIITDLMKYISNIMPNLKVFGLELFRLGFKNENIDREVLNIIYDQLEQCQDSDLEILQLNLGSIGVISTYEMPDYFTDEHTQKLANFILQNKNINVIEINGRSWGYNNDHFTSKSMQIIGEALGQLEHLQVLNLNMYCWNYRQRNFYSERGDLLFFQHIGKLNKLKILSLDFSWFEIDKQFLEGLYQSIGQLKSIESIKLQSKFSQLRFDDPKYINDLYFQNIAKNFHNLQNVREFLIDENIVPSEKLRNYIKHIQIHAIYLKNKKRLLNQIMAATEQKENKENKYTQLIQAFRKEKKHEILEFLIQPQFAKSLVNNKVIESS